MIRFSALKPWTLVVEENLIFVKDPEYPEPHTCTVIGASGQAFGLLVFPGPEGFSFLHRLQNNHEVNSPGRYLENNRSLAAQLGEKTDLDAADRSLLKAFQISPISGPAPYFRSLRPGYLPWVVNEDEGRTLAYCLEAVASLIEDLSPASAEALWSLENHYPIVEESAIRMVEKIPEPDPLSKAVLVDASRINPILARNSKRSGTAQLDFVIVPIPIGATNERKMSMRMAVACDADSGFAYAPQPVQPNVTEGDALVTAFFDVIKSSKKIPREVQVRSESQKIMLSAVAAALGTELTVKPELEALDHMLDALLQHFAGE